MSGEEEMQKKGSDTTALLDRSPAWEASGTKRRNDRQATMVICLLVVLLLAFAVATIVLAVILAGTGRESEDECAEICTSEACVGASAFLTGAMDRTVNPCDDFYRYSCGNWEETNVIPAGFGSWSIFSWVQQSNFIALKRAMEAETAPGEPGAVGKARFMYSACMDVEALSSAGGEPLITNIVAPTGGWGLVGVEESGVWSLDRNLSVEHFYGSNALFGLSIQTDDFDSNKVILQFHQSGITLPGSSYYGEGNNTYDNATKTYMADILLLLGGNDSVQFRSDIEDMYEVERRLAGIFISPTDLRNQTLTYNEITVAEFTANYSSLVTLNDYLDNYFMLAGRDVQFTDEEIVIVQSLEYFKNLNDLLQSFTLNQLKNYAKWSLIKPYITELGQEFLDVHYGFTNIVTGSGETERYLTCVSSVEYALPMAVARPFVDQFFTNNSRNVVGDIISDIRNTFKERLDDKPWLDQATRESCKEKVDKITEAIAYPEFIKDNDKLDAFYENVTIDSTTLYFEAVIQVLLNSRAVSTAQYGQPTDKTRWEIPPTAVNAYYSPSFNRFVFLGGILRPPFFETGWPAYLSYGAIGVVVGHELTHGFDDQGQQYDGDGNRVPWWSPQSQEAFRSRTKCFEDQYSEYSLMEQPVNGSLTLGENIADNGGIHTSYQAYKSRAKELPSLPSTNLTNDQLFFVAFAQVWCTLYTEEGLKHQVTTNVHSPGPIRVLGTISNSQEFSDAFSCPSNSTMNPIHKCELW